MSSQLINASQANEVCFCIMNITAGFNVQRGFGKERTGPKRKKKNANKPKFETKTLRSCSQNFLKEGLNENFTDSGFTFEDASI